MALGAVANDRHGLTAEQTKISIGVVKKLSHPAGSENCVMSDLTQALEAAPLRGAQTSEDGAQFLDENEAIIVIMIASMG